MKDTSSTRRISAPSILALNAVNLFMQVIGSIFPLQSMGIAVRPWSVTASRNKVAATPVGAAAVHGMSRAITSANIVLPVPGGPCTRITAGFGADVLLPGCRDRTNWSYHNATRLYTARWSALNCADDGPSFGGSSTSSPRSLSEFAAQSCGSSVAAEPPSRSTTLCTWSLAMSTTLSHFGAITACDCCGAAPCCVSAPDPSFVHPVTACKCLMTISKCFCWANSFAV